MSIHLLVLNHNGRALLAECLPSVLRAAARSQHACFVSVVDNSSHDDSVAWLGEHHPHVGLYRCPNRGLASFNDVVAQLDNDVIVLLNNDIRLADDAIDPWVAPLVDPSREGEPVWMTAPRAWLFDGVTHEGFRTGLGWHWGLLRATARFEQAERYAALPGETALAGAALAVKRPIFVALGGFDPLYLPGRIEDVDLAYRAFQAGYVARYVPESRVWHRGEASFVAQLGSAASYRLALRNTLLWQLKSLRHPQHWLRLAIGVPLRLLSDIVRAPWQPAPRRFAFTRAFGAALLRSGQALSSTYRVPSTLEREVEFFNRYSIPRLRALLGGVDPQQDEAIRWLRHPISRWYLPAMVEPIVRWLAPSAVRPGHVTALGLIFAVGAVWNMLATQSVSLGAVLLVWLTWLCDRLDGPLARRQLSTSAWGARCDAWTDECVDLGLHLSLAVVIAQQAGTWLPLWSAVAFVFGKLWFSHLTQASSSPDAPSSTPTISSPLRTLYHLPGNSDLRLHLLLAAMLFGWGSLELCCVAVYYNLRWCVVIAKRVLRRAAAVSLSVAEGAVS